MTSLLVGLFALLSTPTLADEVAESARTLSSATSSCTAMSSADFAAAVSRVKKGATDDRLSVAKEITGVSCLSPEQIKNMIALLESERDRLAYAKYAYAHCSDPSSYKKVNDAFTFESSIEELDEYVAGR